jgi:DNA-3-methyladenine glycosylase II
LKQAVTAALEQMLGLRTDLAASIASPPPVAVLGPLAQRFRGMKPSRFPSVFENVVNGIACQQVTLTLGIQLPNCLAEGHGPVVAGEEGPAHAFPRPKALTRLDPDELRRLGFSRQKGRAMIELAQASAPGHAEMKGLAALPDEEAVAWLCRMRGVGR